MVLILAMVLILLMGSFPAVTAKSSGEFGMTEGSVLDLQDVVGSSEWPLPSKQPTTGLKSELFEIDTQPANGNEPWGGSIAKTVHDYMHFSNVAFDETRIHVFAPTAATRKALVAGKRLPHYLCFGCKSRGTVNAMQNMEIIIHDNPLNPAQDCSGGKIRKQQAFFYSPWNTDNVFHLHNDNVLAMVDNIRKTPGCDSVTLLCNLPTVLYNLKGDPTRKPRALAGVIDLLFDSTLPWTDVWPGPQAKYKEQAKQCALLVYHGGEAHFSRLARKETWIL